MKPPKSNIYLFLTLTPTSNKGYVISYHVFVLVPCAWMMACRIFFPFIVSFNRILWVLTSLNLLFFFCWGGGILGDGANLRMHTRWWYLQMEISAGMVQIEVWRYYFITWFFMFWFVVTWWTHVHIYIYILISCPHIFLSNEWTA